MCRGSPPRRHVAETGCSIAYSPGQGRSRPSSIRPPYRRPSLARSSSRGSPSTSSRGRSRSGATAISQSRNWGRSGAHFAAKLNNPGDLVFTDIVSIGKGFPLPGDESGLGVGIFQGKQERMSVRGTHPTLYGLILVGGVNAKVCEKLRGHGSRVDRRSRCLSFDVGIELVCPKARPLESPALARALDDSQRCRGRLHPSSSARPA